MREIGSVRLSFSLARARTFRLTIYNSTFDGSNSPPKGIWVSKGRREIAADDGQAWQAEILHIIRSEISRVTLGKVCVSC